MADTPLNSNRLDAVIMRIRPLEKVPCGWAVSIRLRHVLKRLLRTYFFRCEALHWADEPDPLANLPRPIDPGPPPGNPRPLVPRKEASP
jgi:hypothetical protein